MTTNNTDIQKFKDRNAFMLKGPLARKGYDWWWHSFTAVNKKTGERRPFFIEYYITNPALGGDKPIFGQLPANREKKVRPSYGMVKAGCWGDKHCQVHNFYGIKQVSASFKEMDVRIGDNVATDSMLKGSVSLTPQEAQDHPEYMSDAGTLSWDLKVEKVLSYPVGYGASRFFRWLNAFAMFWHVAGMKCLYSGKVTCNGEEFEAIPEECYGYQDKNWGRDFTSPWVWLSCNNFVSEKTGKKLELTSMDIGGGRPVVFGIPIPMKLLMAFRHEGKLYEYNFSKFYRPTSQNFVCSAKGDDVTWDIKGWSGKDKIEVNFRCDKGGMNWVNYEDPLGQKRYTDLWNGGFGAGTVKLYNKKGKAWELVDTFAGSMAGCEYGVYSH